MSLLVLDSPFGFHIFEGSQINDNEITKIEDYIGKQIDFFEFPNPTYGAMILFNLEKENKIQDTLKKFFDAFMKKDSKYSKLQWIITNPSLATCLNEQYSINCIEPGIKTFRDIQENIVKLLNTSNEEYQKRITEFVIERNQFYDLE